MRSGGATIRRVCRTWQIGDQRDRSVVFRSDPLPNAGYNTRPKVVNSILRRLTGRPVHVRKWRSSVTVPYGGWSGSTALLSGSVRFRIPTLLTRRRTIFAILLLSALFCVAWALWNYPRQVDMSSYVPADCLAFIESNNIADLADHISATDAWKNLAGPIGAKEKLAPNRLLLGVARWTGIGSAEAVIFARSQVGIVFTEPRTTQTGNVLTVKPVAALIIETHTTKTRMRPAIEKAVSGFADRIIGAATRQESETNGAEIIQWASEDRGRQLLMAFVGTARIVSNDESLLLRCVNVRRG